MGFNSVVNILGAQKVDLGRQRICFSIENRGTFGRTPVCEQRDKHP